MKTVLTVIVTGAATAALMVLAEEWPGNQRMPWEPLSNGQEAPLVIDCLRGGGKPQFTKLVTVVGFSPVLDDKSYGMHVNMLPPFDSKTMTDPPSIDIDVRQPDVYPLGCFVRIANKDDIDRQHD